MVRSNYFPTENPTIDDSPVRVNLISNLPGSGLIPALLLIWRKDRKIIKLVFIARLRPGELLLLSAAFFFCITGHVFLNDCALWDPCVDVFIGFEVL